MTGTGWSEILPDAAIASLQYTDAADAREARQAERAERDHLEDQAAAAENQATAMTIAGRPPQTLAEILHGAQGVVADRVPKSMRADVQDDAHGYVGDYFAPVRRSRDAGAVTDPDAALYRAQLAAEQRRADRRAEPAREVMEALAERRARVPQRWPGWTS